MARIHALAVTLLVLHSAAAWADEVSAKPRSEAALRLEALNGQPEGVDRFAEEARLRHYLAVEATDARARDAHRKAGWKAAQRALALDDRHPAALLWWTAHRGSQATPLNPFAAVRIAKEVERAMIKLRTLAPEYEFGAADRVLGKLYLVAPSAVSVGSKSKSKRHLEAAMARAPDYPGNQLTWAEYLLADGSCERGRALARTVAEKDHSQQFPLDAALWKQEAKALLQKAGDCR